MASSRWKRFAFFDRSTLNLPSEILEDIIPIGNSGIGASGSTNRRSIRTLSEAAAAATASNDELVSLAVTTAALPFNAKHKGGTPVEVGKYPSQKEQQGSGTDMASVALDDFWSTLTACHPMDPLSTTATTVATSSAGASTKTGVDVIKLPSQAQNYATDDNQKLQNSSAVDGLVLVFVASRETDRVHCFDVTVRCNPRPMSSPSAGSVSDNKSSLEDLDGWRGYVSPLAAVASSPSRTQHQQSAGNSVEERIIAEHMGATTTSPSDSQSEGIVAVAVCRATSGHRPVHLACVSQTKIVVCVDPHLHLSW
jgi:hypothetical protein